MPAVHVVAPQVWAWRPGRVEGLAAATDVVLCLLPFEPAWFEGRLRAVFVGHPAAALTPDPAGPRPAVALLPGSRPAEVRRLTPTLQGVAAVLRATTPQLHLLTVQAPSAPRLDVPGLVHLDRVEQLAGVRGAVAASGTVTLQLASLGIPQVVLARTDAISWAVGPSVVRTPWVALPNILAGRPVVSEHVQELDPAAIVRDLEHAGPAPLPELGGEEAFGRMADEVLARVAVAP
jgi:lipid-A-disaccharide synthase